MAEAVGGYFVTGTGGSTLLAADFTPGLVIAIVCSTAEDTWAAPSTQYLSCGLASWQDISKTGIRNGCQMQRFRTGGQSSGLYRGKFLYHRNSSDSVVLDGTITTLDDTGATITWTTQTSGYYVYYILVPDQVCYAYTGLSPTPDGSLSLGEAAGGVINLGHGYSADADSQMYTAYIGIDANFYHRYISNVGGSRYSDSHGVGGIGEWQRDYVSSAGPAWGTRWHPDISNTIIGSATSIAEDAAGANIGQGAQSKHITWLSGEDDMHMAFQAALVTSVAGYVEVGPPPFSPQWGFVTACITNDSLSTSVPVGWSYGIWAAANDFHAVCAAGNYTSAGAAAGFNSRLYSFLTSFLPGTSSDYLAGRMSESGTGLRFTTDYASGSMPGHDTRLTGIVGATDDVRHLLPILGVGE